MDNQVKQVNQETIGELVQSSFPLSKMPMDYQLTVHVNNVLNTFGKQSIRDFKAIMDNPKLLETEQTPLRVRQIVAFYGVNKCREWFQMVYGWTYENKRKTKVG